MYLLYVVEFMQFNGIQKQKKKKNGQSHQSKKKGLASYLWFF